MYRVQCTVYSVQYRVCNIKCTLYSVQCTVHYPDSVCNMTCPKRCPVPEEQKENTDSTLASSKDHCLVLHHVFLHCVLVLPVTNCLGTKWGNTCWENTGRHTSGPQCLVRRERTQDIGQTVGLIIESVWHRTLRHRTHSKKLMSCYFSYICTSAFYLCRNWDFCPIQIVHWSELIRRGDIKYELGSILVETSQGALCRQVLQSQVGKLRRTCILNASSEVSVLMLSKKKKSTWR